MLSCKVIEAATSLRNKNLNTKSPSLGEWENYREWLEHS